MAPFFRENNSIFFYIGMHIYCEYLMQVFFKGSEIYNTVKADVGT